MVETRGRLVDLRRTLHDQRLVRALIVEDVDKLVKAGLLLQNIGGEAIANLRALKRRFSLEGLLRGKGPGVLAS